MGGMKIPGPGGSSGQGEDASRGPPVMLQARSAPFAALSQTFKKLLAENPLSTALRRRRKAATAPAAERRVQEGEERQLAQALAAGRRATVLAFYSPHCRLCRSLASSVEEVKQREGSWLNVVSLNATSPGWLPEVSYYSIAYVPCFVLLDGRGRAMAKTGEPFSRRHVMKGLAYLLESMRPVKGLTSA